MVSKQLKYIIGIPHGQFCEAAAVFAGADHVEIAQGFATVVAAGFCRLPDTLNHNVSCWGESRTLRLAEKDNWAHESRGDEDGSMIYHQMYERG